jgi:predicted O-methyltransferase YrrM
MSAERLKTDLLFPANLRVLAEARRYGRDLTEGRKVEGLLADREGLCLYVLGRRAAGRGGIVEIGSWRGRSTWYLATALEDAGAPEQVVAIDPHLEGTQDDFLANLGRSAIEDRVEVHAAFSHDVVEGFTRSPALLWIDGDHSYAGVRRDFDDWFPKLAVGGFVAFHDTVNLWHGPTRLVRELLLHRNDLAEVGVMGTITFARKAPPSRWNRPRLLAARAAFELVTALRGRRVGRGPVNVAATDE